jgi:hypothetical protein
MRNGIQLSLALWGMIVCAAIEVYGYLFHDADQLIGGLAP